jgi:riboflavin synthase
MFSGIVEAKGIIVEIQQEGTNKHFKIQSSLANEAYIDQSIAHNGVCLTVVKIENDVYTVTAIEETLIKSNFNDVQVGDVINLERAIMAHQRMDGHFVQGHVDSTATCKKIELKDGSWNFHFSTSPQFDNLLVEKGSVCINGVSLTLVDAKASDFSVSIIPYTYEHTNFSKIKVHDSVNIEFDIMGKYIVKYLSKLNIGNT